MAILNLHLLDGNTYVIDRQALIDAGLDPDSHQQLELNLLDIGLLNNIKIIVKDVDVTVGNILGVSGLSTTTYETQAGAKLKVDAPLTVGAAGTINYNVGADSEIIIGGTFLGVGLLNTFTINLNGSSSGAAAVTLEDSFLNLNLLGSTTVQNFGPHDMVRVNDDSVDTVRYVPGGLLTSNRLEFVDSNGGIFGTPIVRHTIHTNLEPGSSTGMKIITLADGRRFAVNNDFVYENQPIPCFLPGTLIGTPDGLRAIEELRVGDVVLTVDGRAEKIVWTGHRTITRAMVAEARLDRTQPIRFVQGSLGENLPQRDLVVSPDHCLVFKGTFIPARVLVNGTTVVQEMDRARYTYHHIELENFGVVLAEGFPAETYLDTGNRGTFIEAAVVDLHPVIENPRERVGAHKVMRGPAVRAVRAQIAERAEAIVTVAEERMVG